MANNVDRQYLELLEKILREGEERMDRTGVGVFSIFGYQMRFNLKEGFPILTTKKIHFKSVVYELLWFLRGDTNVRFLQENGVTIWDEWADENGELGPIYGKQWRRWECPDGKVVDQVATVIETIKKDPYSRRLVVSAWNVADLPRMSLPPCHVLFQFYVNKHGISCHMYQRSGDVFLGVPFNISSYSLLLCMVGHVTGYEPHELIISYGDIHLYRNHIEQARTQLSREPRPLPLLRFKRRVSSIDEFTYEDIELIGYDPWPRIPAPVAV